MDQEVTACWSARQPARRELAAFRDKLKAKPANYIAQPTLALSTVPVLAKSGLAPRHVDLRPFVLVSPKKHQDHPPVA